MNVRGIREENGIFGLSSSQSRLSKGGAIYSLYDTEKYSPLLWNTPLYLGNSRRVGEVKKGWEHSGHHTS